MHFDFNLFLTFAGIAFGAANLADDLRIGNRLSALLQIVFVLICCASLASRLSPA